MIIKHLRLLLFLSCLSIISCKTTKYSLNNLPENTITIGDGGGFAGIETSYMLLDNGQVFRQNLPGDTVELKSIKTNQAKDFYEQFKSLRLHRLDIENPGNLYYFISFTDPEIDHRITWGAADYNPRSDILHFYKSLKKTVRDLGPAKSPKMAASSTPKEDKKKAKKEKKEKVTGW